MNQIYQGNHKLLHTIKYSKNMCMYIYLGNTFTSQIKGICRYMSHDKIEESDFKTQFLFDAVNICKQTLDKND